MDEMEKDVKTQEGHAEDHALFAIQEIKIEEMAIDGICGVY